jgi:hypothetical protein
MAGIFQPMMVSDPFQIGVGYPFFIQAQNILENHDPKCQLGYKIAELLQAAQPTQYPEKRVVREFLLFGVDLGLHSFHVFLVKLAG